MHGKGDKATHAEKPAETILAEIMPRSRDEAHPEAPVDAGSVNAATRWTSLPDAHCSHFRTPLSPLEALSVSLANPWSTHEKVSPHLPGTVSR